MLKLRNTLKHLHGTVHVFLLFYFPISDLYIALLINNVTIIVLSAYQNLPSDIFGLVLCYLHEKNTPPISSIIIRVIYFTRKQVQDTFRTSDV